MQRCEQLQLVILQAFGRGGGGGEWSTSGKRARHGRQEEQVATISALQSAPVESPGWLFFHCFDYSAPLHQILCSS